jgi:hypothetical protein
MSEETLDPPNQTEGDTKEGLYFGREVPADSEEAHMPLHGPNQWPAQACFHHWCYVAHAYNLKTPQSQDTCLVAGQRWTCAASCGAGLTLGK